MPAPSSMIANTPLNDLLKGVFLKITIPFHDKSHSQSNIWEKLNAYIQFFTSLNRPFLMFQHGFSVHFRCPVRRPLHGTLFPSRAG
jgi:hypothetical protein